MVRGQTDRQLERSVDKGTERQVDKGMDQGLDREMAGWKRKGWRQEQIGIEKGLRSGWGRVSARLSGQTDGTRMTRPWPL